MTISAADRDKLLAELIRQLQEDHRAAVAAGNVSAAVSASKTIADLLSLKLAPAAPEPNGGGVSKIERVIISLTDDELRGRIRHLDRNIAELEGKREDSSDTSSDEAVSAPQPSPEDRALAERLLQLLGDKDELAEIGP